MLDIDFFKKINDSYGHATGDEVIKRLAKLMQKQTRKSDIVARFGGEEFVILLPKTDIKKTLYIAQKLQKFIDKEEVRVDATSVCTFSVSMGISGIKKSDKSIEEALNRADKALYKAKENGRDQIVVSEDEAL